MNCKIGNLWSGAFKKYICHEVEWGEGGWVSLKAKENKKGEGVKPICIFALWKKIAWFFKQQTKFFLISCLAVAKSFAVLSLISFNVFYELSNILIPVVYITVLKNIDLLRWVYKKTNLLFECPLIYFTEQL